MHISTKVVYITLWHCKFEVILMLELGCLLKYMYVLLQPLWGTLDSADILTKIVVCEINM